MRTILYDHNTSRDTVHTDNTFFQCARCLHIKPVQTNGGTGYAYRSDDKLVCYACCGQVDRQDMTRNGRAVMYLTHNPDRITNWPGTLTFSAEVRPMRHPFAREAYLVRFRGPDGAEWSAKNIGDSQIAHCRRLKA